MSQGFEVTPSRGHADYQVKHYDEGVVFYSNSGIPVSVVSALGGLVPGPDKKKLIAIGLHPYFQDLLGSRVVYAIAQNEETLKAWEEKVEEEIAARKDLTVLGRWLIGIDTGVSAKTMVQAAFPDTHITSDFGVPHDPGDFGRCMRAVDHFTSAMGTADPEIRQRFLDPESYKGKGAAWPKILERWDELCAIARQAGLSTRRGQLSKGPCEALYEILKQF